MRLGSSSTDEPAKADGVPQAPVVEIRGVHDQRIVLPAATRVPQPQADVLADTRPPVQRDDASVVVHLVEQHDVSRSLKQLHVMVVLGTGKGDQRRSVGFSHDTALDQVAVLRAVRGANQDRQHGSPSLLCLGRQGRNCPVRRVHNQRGSPVGCESPSRCKRQGKLIRTKLVCALFQCSRFLFRPHRLPRKITGSS